MAPLSPAARTILYFSYYIWLAALFMLLSPQALLAPGSSPDTTAWVRTMGAVLLILGLYYHVSARTEQRGFFQATVWGRWAALPLFGLLAALGWVPWVMAAGTLVDVVGAFWTAAALRRPQ